MDINRLTEKTQEALHAAQSEALRRGNQQIDVEHLLAALLSQEGGLAGSILKRAGAKCRGPRMRRRSKIDKAITVLERFVKSKGSKKDRDVGRPLQYRMLHFPESG